MIRTEATNRFTFYTLACLAIVALPTIVVGDETSGQTENVPHGNVAEISDWALAGVVWSDASLAKKIAVAAAKQTTDKDRLRDLNEHITRFDGILGAMKHFGWQQLLQAPASSPGQGARRLPTRKVRIAPIVNPFCGRRQSPMVWRMAPTDRPRRPTWPNSAAWHKRQPRTRCRDTIKQFALFAKFALSH